MTVLRGLLFFILFSLSGMAHAKYFRNEYVSFELPPQWQCRQEGRKWTCENGFENQTRYALISVHTKNAARNDTVAQYLIHLQSPKTLMGENGKASRSQVIQVKERVINNQIWADGVHLGSQAEFHFTRYLATVRGHSAILVMFTARKEEYSKYSGDFLRAIDSLRVLNDKKSSKEDELKTWNDPYSSIFAPEDLPQEGRRHAKRKYVYWFLLALALGGTGFYFYRRRQRQNKRPRGVDRRDRR